MTNTKLLQLRKKINARRPEFFVQDRHKRKEAPQDKWRRPKGMHNKMRHGVWGRPVCVNIGYRNPAEVRGLAPNGLMPVLINNVSELAKINTKTQGAILAKVGGRNKVQILEECKKKQITVLNVKNVDNKIKEIKENVADRQKARAAKSKIKQQKAPAPKNEEKKDEKVTKEQEQKEREKVITQRE